MAESVLQEVYRLDGQNTALENEFVTSVLQNYCKLHSWIYISFRLFLWCFFLQMHDTDWCPVCKIKYWSIEYWKKNWKKCLKSNEISIKIFANKYWNIEYWVKYWIAVREKCLKSQTSANLSGHIIIQL